MSLATSQRPAWQPYVTRLAQDFATGKLPRLEDVEAELMTRSLAEFVKGAWHVIEPVTELVWNWHMDVVCEHVQALVTNTLGKNNLIVNVPPGTSKTTIVSVCVMPWLWLRRPSYRGNFASGNPTVTSRSSVMARRIISSDWYQRTFKPKWTLSDDQNEKLRYANTETGERAATTTDRDVTGERYNGLFLDDAVDAKKAFYQSEIDAANTWWDTSYWNRIADEKTSTRCIIGQRLRQGDICDHVLEKLGALAEATWERVVIPQEWEEKARRVTSLGWTDPRKEEGELLFPARFSAKALTVERLVLGQSSYEGQHQQRPTAAKGEIFARGHAQFIVRGSIPPATISRSLISWDTAVKVEQQNDYSVSLVGQEFDRGIFISECIRKKMKYPALKETAKLQAARVPVSALLIEDKQSGQQLIQELQQFTSLPVVPVQVGVDKVARAWAVVPYWEANRVFFPCDENGVPEPWVEEFLEELYAFPKAAHDDQVDAFTQLLIYAVLTPGGQGWVEFLQRQVAAQQAAEAEQKRMDEIHHPVHQHKLNGAQ